MTNTREVRTVKTYGTDVTIGDVIVSNMGEGEYVGTVETVPVIEDGRVVFQINDAAGITKTYIVRETRPVYIEIPRRTS